ncbi:MAG: hypothetical protein ACR2LR_09530 [Hassallia sp.]
MFETAQKTKHYGILDSDYMNDHRLMREGFSSSVHQTVISPL